MTGPRIPRDPIRDLAREAAPTANAQGRVRRRKNSSNTDKFHIPEHLIPEGTSMNWKRHATLGKEDPYHTMDLLENGWRPVDASSMPGMVPAGYTGAVTREGMVLMERPLELTREAEDEDYARAKNQVRAKEAEMGMTPAGHMDRKLRTLNKTMERPTISIPD